LLSLSTATLAELEALVTGLGHPRYRASQIRKWVWDQGITEVDEMNNLPKMLRNQLRTYTRPSSLTVAAEQVSRKDGTVKRAYRCADGQIIESVLMRYEDGRCTACISSQAGCAQRCSFCATGHMGFSRQLSSDEILEQVYHFSALLRREQQQSKDVSSTSSPSTRQKNRLSNVVFMGMGEPLANYRKVNAAVQRIIGDVGIGARRITVSTVGIVPNIRRMMEDPTFPPVKLAVSLHAANDPARSAMIPANDMYGGLDSLMTTLKEYVDATSRRITLEWALIDQVNDLPSVARELGRLVQHHAIRKDMVHVNVIPLNPTAEYTGSPSQRKRVDAFCAVLEQEFGIACTPRVRRGIDIDAGCGQLKSSVLRKPVGTE
jgi:23S rRNA (adenine2503-C2)-methyltransferase